MPILWLVTSLIAAILALDSFLRAWFVLHSAPPPLALDEPPPGTMVLAVVISAHDEEAMRWFLKAASEAPGGAVSYLFRIPHVYIAGNCNRGAVAVVRRVVVGARSCVGH
jgi:hypothetical protein